MAQGGDNTPGEIEVRQASHLVVSVFAVLFNVLGLPYKGLYDNLLILVSFVFNGSIMWNAWTWVSTG